MLQIIFLYFYKILTMNSFSSLFICRILSLGLSHISGKYDSFFFQYQTDNAECVSRKLSLEKDSIQIGKLSPSRIRNNCY